VELGGAPSTGKPWFGILGPLAAGVDGGQRLELGGHKQRELLALLLINRNRCLPAARIADALWHGAPPAGADATLRSHVSHLRHRLAGFGGQHALVTRPASLSTCWSEAGRRCGSVKPSALPDCSPRR
jgi:serine/threonine-protein kinase PknK